MREIRFPLPPASERSKRPHNHLTAGGALRIPASPPHCHENPSHGMDKNGYTLFSSLWKMREPCPAFHRHTSKSSQHFGKKPQHHSRDDYIVDEWQRKLYQKYRSYQRKEQTATAFHDGLLSVLQRYIDPMTAVDIGSRQECRLYLSEGYFVSDSYPFRPFLWPISITSTSVSYNSHGSIWAVSSRGAPLDSPFWQ